jgi:hypothetical protein
MKYSQIKALKSFCEDQHSMPDWKDVLSNLQNNEDDFTVDNVRFIADDNILSIMADDIFSDNYCLGCFNASFIASNSNLNFELVEACQQAEAFEAIGKALNDTLDQDGKESFCEAYASADSYGHHFNGYDFSESEYRFNGKLYHVFDNR